MLEVLEEYDKYKIDEKKVTLDKNKEIIKREEDLVRRETKLLEKENMFRMRSRELSDRISRVSQQKYMLDVKESDLNTLRKMLEVETNLLSDEEKRLIIDIIDYAIFHGYWVSNRLDRLRMDDKNVNDVLRKLGLSENKIKNIGV